MQTIGGGWAFLALGMLIGIAYMLLLLRRRQLRSGMPQSESPRTVSEGELRTLQIVILAAAAVMMTWIVFRRPPVPPTPGEIRELRRVIDCCCREPTPPPGEREPRIFGRTPGEVSIVGAVLFGALGAGLYLANKGTRKAGGAMLALSGLLTLNGAKMLPIEKIFEVKKVFGVETLLTVNANRVMHESSTGGLPLPGGAHLTEFTREIAYFETGKTKLPSCDKIDEILHHGVPNLVVVVGRVDRRELRNALLRQYGSNWHLALRRADAVSDRFKSVPLVIKASAPPCNWDRSADEKTLGTDRAVTIHAFFVER